MQEQIARTFIEALKDQPLSLALVAMNILLLGFLYYDGIAHTAERKEELQMLYKNRELVADLLFKCQPPAEHR